MGAGGGAVSGAEAGEVGSSGGGAVKGAVGGWTWRGAAAGGAVWWSRGAVGGWAARLRERRVSAEVLASDFFMEAKRYLFPRRESNACRE